MKFYPAIEESVRTFASPREALKAAGAPARQVRMAISRLRGQFGAASSAAGDLARSVRNVTLAAAGLGALGAFGAKRFGSGVIETSAKFEMLTAAMTTQFDGSEKAARSAMGWVSEFAKKTPYEIEEVTRAFISLKTMGLDPIQGDALRILGDTAAAFSRPIDDTVQAITDVMNRDTERLKQLGITSNINSQKDEITFSWREQGKDIQKTVQISNKTLIAETILALWNKKYAGAMDRMSRAWSGLMSNMADSWARFQLSIGDAGFFEAMKGRLAGLYDAVLKFTESARGLQLAKDISGSLTTIVDALLPSVGTLERWVFAFADWLRALDPGRIKSFADSAAATLGRLGQALKGITWADVSSFFGDLRTVVGGLASAFRLVSSVAHSAFDWMDQITGGNGAKVLGWMIGIRALLGPSLGKFLLSIGRMAVAFGKFAATSRVFDILRAGFSGFLNWIPRIGIAMGRLVLANPVLTGIVVAVGALAVGAYLLWKNWDKVTAWFEDRLTLLSEWFDDAWTGIKDSAGEAVRDMADWAIGGFREMYDGVTGWAERLYRNVTEWFTDLQMSIANIDWLGLGRDVLSKVWDGMKSIGGSIRDWVRELFDFSGLSRMSGRLPWGGGYAAPKPEMASWIDQMAGVFGANAATLKQIAYRESGYRTASINTTDSNAQRGTPSAGLFQFIEPTFNDFYDRAHRQHGAFLDRLGPKNWLNWRQQSAIAAWAFAHGKASHWTTWRGEPTTGAQSPAFTMPDVAGPIGRSLKGLTMPEPPSVAPESAPSAPQRAPGRWLNQPLRQAAGDGLQVASKIDSKIAVQIFDHRIATTSTTRSDAAARVAADVGINRVGKPRSWRTQYG